MLANDIAENPGPSDGFSIFHWNIRSIRNKLDHIKDMIDSNDILCFTETHLDIHVPTSDLLIDLYKTPLRRDRTNHGGGILVYYKCGLLVKRRHDLENQLDEVIWTEINLPSKTVLMCTIYRPPGHPNTEFWTRMENALSLAMDETQFIVMNGDWNIDFLQSIPPSLHSILRLFDLTNIITDQHVLLLLRLQLLTPSLFQNLC